MKIPKRLKIGGHLVTVRFSKDIEDNGFSDTVKNEIVINANLPQSQREATLIHEVLHFLNTTIKHDLLDSLSEQIYQVLSDNKIV